ncbi:hypothetical protein BRC81_08375 [Halobacteriales archaeon QS_1_68_20]|nr:MAG: hypothetical protein BRC81_08375 [Halobacteriales archaeon QS_1_68_20]
MPSRRQVPAGIGTVAGIGLAGCTGSDSGGSGTTDCQTQALAHGDGDLLDGGAMATVEDGDVRLTVPLSVEKVDRQDVTRLLVYDAAGELEYVIPVSPDDADVMANSVGEGRLRYEQYLGHRPFHGQYEIVAENAAGDTVDTITVGCTG